MVRLFPNSSTFSYILASKDMVDDPEFEFIKEYLKKVIEKDLFSNKEVKSIIFQSQNVVRKYKGEELEREKKFILSRIKIKEVKRNGKNKNK